MNINGIGDRVAGDGIGDQGEIRLQFRPGGKSGFGLVQNFGQAVHTGESGFNGGGWPGGGPKRRPLAEAWRWASTSKEEYWRGRRDRPESGRLHRSGTQSRHSST